MVIDTSAVLAILLGEPEADLFVDRIVATPRKIISVATLFETMIVVETKKGEAGGRELDLFLHRANIDAVTVTQEHLELARYGWRRYGKGRHKASLNFGDCFSYALARYSGLPLLFKGNDFPYTDVASACSGEA